MFHENLKKLRKAKGLSQEALAERLHVTRQTISKWENQLSVPDADLLIRLAEIFEVPVSRLLGREVEPSAEADPIAGQLEQLNLLLAQRNQRNRRIWRVVAGILIALAVLTVLMAVLHFAAFQSFSQPEATVTEITAPAPDGAYVEPEARQGA